LKDSKEKCNTDPQILSHWTFLLSRIDHWLVTIRRSHSAIFALRSFGRHHRLNG